jgi:hypothetical protein
MGRPGWLNDNEYRAYPFIPQDSIDVEPSGEILPADLIVDCGIIMGIEAEFDDASDYVYLHQIRRTVDAIEIELRTTAPGAEDYPLVFTRALDVEEWTYEDVNAGVGSDSSSAYGCGESARWEGFLITGVLTSILSQLGEGDTVTYTAGEWHLEPARIQNLKKAFLQSIGLANYDRTRWHPDPDCEEDPAGEREVIVREPCLNGPLRLKEGYNCSIRQEDVSNTITIGASIGAGAGLACNEVPLYDGEVSPDGATTLDGAATCTEVLKTINGVGGRVIRLFGGQGIAVTASDDQPHTVIVTVSLQGFAYCPANE